MHRKLIGLAAVLLLAGCQGASWQNPYAAIGPARVPPPGMKEATEGYYTPPPATPTLSATSVPVVEVPAANERPSLSSSVRTTIATPVGSASSSSSFATSGSGVNTEPPIRIVEAAPAANPAARAVSAIPAAAAPIREPKATPGVVTANPSSIPSSVPTVKFNPSTAPAELSRLPAPPAATPAGVIPASPAPVTPVPAPPKNRVSAAPGMLPDPYVRPATFVETSAASATEGWKSR